MYLDYVFDISDTHSSNAPVKLWQYQSRFDGAIIETLENSFGELSSRSDIVSAVISAAENAVSDNKADYLAELKYAKENSFLEDLDELNIDVEFQQTAEVSIAYMILHRLGLNPDMFFEREDFPHIMNFNTPQTLSALGSCVASITENALRDISQTIRAELKTERTSSKIFAETKNTVYNLSADVTAPQTVDDITSFSGIFNPSLKDEERTFPAQIAIYRKLSSLQAKQEHCSDLNEIKEDVTQTVNNASTDNDDRNENSLHGSERVSVSELDSTETDNGDRQIRADAEEIPQESPTEPVFEPDDNGQNNTAFAGSGNGSETTDRTDNEENSTDGRHNGGTQSERSDSVDGNDELGFTFGGGNRTAGSGLQLSLFDTILTEDEQKNIVQKAAQEIFGAAFAMPEPIVDEVLCDGSNDKDSIIEICIEFSKDKPIEKKGGISERCELNRQIKEDNRILREIKKRIRKLTEAVKRTLPAVAETLEKLRSTMIHCRYVINFADKWKTAKTAEAERLKIHCNDYSEIIAELKSKISERKQKQDEKAKTPPIKIFRHKELTQAIHNVEYLLYVGDRVGE